MDGSVLVFGASGTVGTQVVKELLGHGVPVQAASRTGKAMEGAKPVKFDFGVTRDFQTLLQGISGMFLLSPTGHPDSVGTLSPIIAAASARGIKIVYLSAFGTGEQEDHEDHHRIEQVLNSSGAAYTSLRPNWFSDNFHTFWKNDIL